MTGVSRPRYAKALGCWEAMASSTRVNHRGTVVRTISLDEAKQLYAAAPSSKDLPGVMARALTTTPLSVRRTGAPHPN